MSAHAILVALNLLVLGLLTYHIYDTRTKEKFAPYQEDVMHCQLSDFRRPTIPETTLCAAQPPIPKAEFPSFCNKDKMCHFQRFNPNINVPEWSEFQMKPYMGFVSIKSN